jgi:hypothetical protein
MSDMNDGADKPVGFTTDDGELEVRETDGEKCYHETALGQHQRWLRQAPDLYEKYITVRNHGDLKWGDWERCTEHPDAEHELVCFACNPDLAAESGLGEQPFPREMQHTPRADCQTEGWHLCVGKMAHRDRLIFDRARAIEAALRRILTEPHGCPACHSGKIITLGKAHWDSCGYAMAAAALEPLTGDGVA